MEHKGERTRERILDISQKLILGKGFSGTSIDEIVAESQITKGGFFYHFDGKNDLAVQLIKRYLAMDEVFFSSTWERASGLTDDSLERILIFIKLMAETLADIPNGHPGCLVATFTYESQLFDPEIRDLIFEGVVSWRKMFHKMFAEAVKDYPKAKALNPKELSDMCTTVIEGGILLSRILGEPQILPQQLLQYRNYIKLLFKGA